MRSVFFTKPKSLTEKCLEHLIDREETVLAVVLSNKEAYLDSEFVRLADGHGIPIIDYVECDEFFAKNAGLIEMIWCNTFPKRIKSAWIDSASIAAVNFHAAPLPDYRGVFGFNFAFLNGEREFGVTAHMLDGDFDTGAVIEVDRFPFDFESGSVKELVELSEEYMLDLFKRTYDRFARGEDVLAEEQDLTAGAYYSRDDFEKSKLIVPSDSADDIYRKVRAFWFPPYEGAYVVWEGKRLPVVTKEILDGLR